MRFAIARPAGSAGVTVNEVGVPPMVLAWAAHWRPTAHSSDEGVKVRIVIGSQQGRRVVLTHGRDGGRQRQEGSGRLSQLSVSCHNVLNRGEAPHSRCTEA